VTNSRAASLRVSIERAVARSLMALPATAQRSLARALPTTPLARELLHPQFQVLVGLNATRPSLQSQTVRAARGGYRMMMQMLSPAPVPMAKSVDLQVPVPATGASRADRALVRLHYPLPTTGPTPAIVFFHGGGFTVGDVPSYDACCRDIAAQTGFPVASVEYRMGPEHPAPAATEDCVAVWRYMVEHAQELQLDPTRMAVMGDSAGGKLSAAVSQQAKQRGLTLPALQVLVYPGVDLSRDLPSKETYGVGFGLEKATIDWFMSHYVDDAALKLDPRVSPQLTKDLTGLPPAIVVVASDPLRDEGLEYAKRLQEAGVKVELLDYPRLIHGFFTMGGVVPVAATATAEVLGRTRSLLGKR